jgi:hypothetical protein
MGSSSQSPTDTGARQMTTEQAKSYVASLLAYRTWQSIDILKTVPNLDENTAEMKEKNLAAAIAFGIEGQYRATCSLYNVSVDN